MIAFGASMLDPEVFRRFCRPGIELAAEPDSEIYAYAAAGPVCRSYNLVLDRATGSEELEALVVVQQHLQIDDADLCRKIREALSDPEVGVVGCMGATGVQSMAWWEGSISAARITQRYREHGGGDMPALGWTEHGPAPAEVETLDGSLLVLSPWVARNIRFDESLFLGHGYDFDFCQQVRASGRKVMTADFNLVDHRPLRLVKDDELDPWIEAHIRIAEKWEGRMPGQDSRGDRLEGARPAGGGGARGGQDDRLLEHAQLRRPDPAARARAGGDHEEPLLAADRTPAQAEQRAQALRRIGSRGLREERRPDR